MEGGVGPIVALWAWPKKLTCFDLQFSHLKNVGYSLLDVIQWKQCGGGYLEGYVEVSPAWPLGGDLVPC